MAAGPTPNEALGIGAQWRHDPIAWGLVKMAVAGEAGARPVHVLVIEHATGKSAFVFSADELRALGTAMLENAAGLSIATEIPTNGRH